MIKKIIIPSRSEEWFAFRKGKLDFDKTRTLDESAIKFLKNIDFQGGLGGSDAGTLLGLNEKYEARIELYYKCLDVIDPFEDTKETFWGKHLEDIIADTWQYTDGTVDGYIKNFNEKKIQRKAHKDNGFIVNDKWPWLFYSKDRRIVNGSFRLDTGEVLSNGGILECKTVNYFARKHWEDEIDPSYSGQLAQGLMICEVDYGEMAIFDNMRNFDVYYYGRNEAMERLMDRLVESSKFFWHEMVLPAKEAIQKLGIEKFTIDNVPAEIQKYEPEVESTEAYKNFLSRYARTDIEAVEGESLHYELAQRHKVAKSLQKHLNKFILEPENELRAIMAEAHVQRLEFGKEGHVSYKRDKNDTIRFSNSIKKFPSKKDEESMGKDLKDFFDEINFKYL